MHATILNNINLRLQGKDSIFSRLVGHIFFVNKLLLFYLNFEDKKINKFYINARAKINNAPDYGK